MSSVLIATRVKISSANFTRLALSDSSILLIGYFPLRIPSCNVKSIFCYRFYYFLDGSCSNLASPETYVVVRRPPAASTVSQRQARRSFWYTFSAMHSMQASMARAWTENSCLCAGLLASTLPILCWKNMLGGKRCTHWAICQESSSL